MQSAKLSPQPHNLEAEKTVLGAILLDPEAIVSVLPILMPEDFYDPIYRQVYSACVQLHDQRQAVDFVTVAGVLKSNDKIQELGGSAFLAQLAEAVPTASHVAQYAHMVREKSRRRALIQAGQKIAGIGYQEDQTFDALIDESHRQLLAVSDSGRQFTPESLGDVTVRRYEQVSELQAGGSPEELRRVKTGFGSLDYYFNGFAAGSLTIVAARPGMGKTCLLVDLAIHAAQRENKQVLFFSLEMQKEEISDRITAAAVGVPTWRMQKGDMTDEQLAQFGPMIDAIRDDPLYLDDDPDATLSNIRAKALRHQLEHGLDLVVVDYLQLIEAGGQASYQTNRTQEVSIISRGLKKLAKELRAPVVAASQLSRAVENRPLAVPMLSDLRESGSIEQDADNVMMLWREGEYNEDCENADLTTVFIRKHRQGPTGSVELVFNREKMSFSSLHRGDADPPSKE